ncbi:gamma-glutamyltransferase family protein [Nitratireductor sp. ZSWI3]|uniref:gamma-glutamyltransferase family protein n=1 Tax=Nitratireductor sp. ZSWI3 TaxID=2966359 RepID=UPI00214FC99C|nr:gamma-glutamyltransferase family protein [Nitratireductor sp. ZSWI3]MCR4267601.1 gamma-glutamyltransferase family protein [Nitratireductor sp. ZSWI3]
MLHTALGYNCSFSAPHRAAALAGRDVLESGGTAIEAMVAAAATVAVVYPHMNGIGGDGFWLIKRAGEAPVGISGCGRAAELATVDWYARRGLAETIPARGAAAALTVPGTLSGWQRALDMVPSARRMPLADLLSAAIGHAHDGMAITGNQSRCTRDKLDSLAGVPGFADVFLVDGKPPEAGHKLRQPALARTLETLACEGIEAFYRGDIAAEHARFLEAHDSPLRFDDFARFSTQTVEPLSVTTSDGVLYNMTPPTQGISSLMILALFDRLGVTAGEGFDHVHGLVEATKQAFLIRNRTLGDPETMEEPAAAWLTPNRLDALARGIDRQKALPWPYPPKDGDTIWMGAVDREGTVVSFIQSVFWEFGSGLTCPATGVFFQNRGAGFSLQPGPNQLAPGKRPFHTLNPALARLADGRIMAYGTMGGEGQPQTQAAIFTRYARFKQNLQQAVSMPRWLLGKTWGDATTTLKLESRFTPSLVAALKAAGHEVELIEPYSDLAGHAGAVVLHESGLMEAASDPRSDGTALAY